MIDADYGLRPSSTLTTLVDKFASLDVDERSSHGYLPDRTSDVAGRHIIAAENLVCAWDMDDLAGFYLADHWQHTYPVDRFRYFKAVMDAACLSKDLDPETVGCGAQCVIDIPYQGRGLRPLLLYALLGHVKSRFAFLFSKISKDNKRATKGHLRDGWYSVAEDEEYIFVLLDVKATMSDLSAPWALSKVPGSSGDSTDVVPAVNR